MSLVTKEVNEHTNIRFQCDKIGLDYFTEWPSVSVVIQDGRLSIPAEEELKEIASDYLTIDFQTFGGKVNLKKLLFDRELSVENVFLEDADIQVDISKKMVSIAKQKSNKNNQLFFNVNEIRLKSINLNANDSLHSIKLNLSGLNLHIDGDLNTVHPSFIIHSCNASIETQGFNPLSNRQFDISLTGNCDATENFHDIQAESMELQLGQFPFKLQGKISNIGKNEKLSINLTAELTASNIREIIEQIPDELVKDLKPYNIDGIVSCTLRASGEMGRENIPHIRAEGLISKGKLYKKGERQGFDTISLAFLMNYDDSINDSCYVDLKNLKVSGLESRVKIDGHIGNFIHNPFVYGDVEGNIDFDRISKEMIDPSVIRLNGHIFSDISFAFSLQDLKQMNFHRVWAEGILKTEGMEAHSDKNHFNFYAKGLNMEVGYKKNRGDFFSTAEVLSCDADIDTLNFFYSDSISCDVSKLHLRANTTLDKDSSSVTPATVHINWNKLRAQTNNHTSFSLQDSELHVGVKPSAISKMKPEGAFVLKADEISYLDTKNMLATLMSQANVISEFRPSSAQAGSELTLKNWNVKSQLDFASSSFFSSYYPKRIDITNSRIGYSNNQLILNRTQIKAEDTTFMLSGALVSEKDSLLHKQILNGSLHLVADNINFNDFANLFLSGESGENDNSKIEHSLTPEGINLESLLRKDSLEKKNYPLYIPDNLKIDVQLDVDRAFYEDAELHQVSGNIEVTGGKAHANVTMRTNVGKASMNAVYDSRNRDKLFAIFDVDLHDVLLAQLDKVMPSLNKMFPMAKSLDGLANVRLTGQSILDEDMKSVLSSAKVAGTLKGQNLTLIDNSTFDEIASKLRFKNKERNLIDKIEVNFILNNGVIEVIPFIMEWDRYKAMAGGTNTLDMTYDYHIDLLKSPIPINFGLDLNGKSNDFHYKITLKRKYKELFKDDGVELSQTTSRKMNEVREAINAQILQLMKR